MYVRRATLEDLPEMTRIYNQGIEDRTATFETALRTEQERREWFERHGPRHPVIVAVGAGGAERGTGGRETVLGWLSLNPFSPRLVYNGIADISIYVDRSCRGQGVGMRLMQHAVSLATDLGYHKLVLATFPFNVGGMTLYRKSGFQVVGTYRHHGFSHGVWSDVTLMERTLEPQVATADGQVGLRRAVEGDWPPIARLLEEAGLPLAGAHNALGEFEVAYSGGEVAGAVALEHHGRFILLRSLVVDERWRSLGVGKALVGRALRIAKACEAQGVYLLTTTADAYFERHGFCRVARSDVPTELLESVEFQDACPASAVVMRRPAA